MMGKKDNKSLVKQRWGQFKDYLSSRKEEGEEAYDLLQKYKERGEVKAEYQVFKDSFLHKIETLFEAGCGELVIQPREEYLDLYNALLNDKEFRTYYDCSVDEGNLLRVSKRAL